MIYGVTKCSCDAVAYLGLNRQKPVLGEEAVCVCVFQTTTDKRKVGKQSEACYLKRVCTFDVNELKDFFVSFTYHDLQFFLVPFYTCSTT